MGNAQPKKREKSSLNAPVLRAAVEMGFIIFLFYSNLLMGEFTRSGGQGKTLLFALEDVCTLANFLIALVTSLVGYLIFEALRKKL
jgi:hypothetical protein